MLKLKSLAKISFLAIFLLILDILTLTATPNAHNNSSVLVISKAQGYEDKPLRLTVTVNDPSSLRVHQGTTVKQGDVLADNFRERSRLIAQKQTIFLQIAKLKDQQPIAPVPLRQLPPLRPLPDVDYVTEIAAISQAKLRLRQAKLILATRTPWLNLPKDSVYKQTVSKVEQQKEMLNSMQESKMQPEIIQHETAVLKQIQAESHKAHVDLLAANAQQSQELQQLKINVELAESELEQKQAALEDAKYHRHLQEFQASVDARTHAQQEQQISLEHSRQMALYEQQRRDKNYQLAELNIQQHQIEDKLADLPIVRSPKSGYIKHIKPWVGKDGEYTTTLTISSFPHARFGSSIDSTPDTGSYN